MKTKDELYQKVRLTPRVPRVVLKSNSQMGLQDKQEQDARTSCDQPSGSKLPWETGRNTVDYRIFGVLLSAVEQQDTHRKDKVKKMIEKFENHPNKESFVRVFSKESQDLIADMNNTEIFEFFENSVKQQCPDCNLYWEAGTVYCSCGRCPRISRNEKESTRATTMSCRYPAMLSIRRTSAEPDMDVTRPEKCYIKQIKRNMENTHPFLRDGSATTDAESRCRTLDGLRRTSCYLTELPWKISDTSRQEPREFDMVFGAQLFWFEAR